MASKLRSLIATAFLALALIPSAQGRGFDLEQSTWNEFVNLKGVRLRIVGDSVVEIEGVRSFFESRNNVSIWVDQNNRANGLAGTFREIVMGSRLSGLTPTDYWSADIEQRMNPKDRAQAIELELLLTQSFLKFARELATGRIDPSSIDNEIDFKRRPLADFATLNAMLSTSETLKQGLASLEPKHQQYLNLKNLVSLYEKIRTEGGWPIVRNAPKKLQIGASSPVVPVIRKRLSMTGHLPESEISNVNPVFDESLKQGILLYQRQHVLPITGIADTTFFTSINIPVEKRIQMVTASMEKWRWLPQDLGERYIFVNLARQELSVFENRQPVMKMKVVVGRTLRRTPSLSDRIVDVALNPYWNVPQNLVLKDVLPGIKADPLYLEKNGMKVFTPDGATEIDPTTIHWPSLSPETVNLRFRQEPGVHNSLGIVKFNLTNSRAIYMHDTPHKELFPEQVRYFSSGCVRLEKPVELATYLLKGIADWDLKKIKKFTSQEPLEADYRIPLENPMPVHLAYLAVSFTDDGEVRFNSDNYGQDERLIRALQATEGAR